MKKCLLEWCNKRVKPNGKYCSAHYEQRRIYGKFLTPNDIGEIRIRKEKERKANIKYCKICGKVAPCKNLCEKHYCRFHKYGNPTKTKHTGKRLAGSGYMMIKNWKHPKTGASGYIREHRLIMEKYLGRYLTSKEIVHHKDGNPQNNDIDNLVLVDNQQNHIKRYHHKREIIL